MNTSAPLRVIAADRLWESVRGVLAGGAEGALLGVWASASADGAPM